MLQQWLSHKLIECRSPLWSLLCEAETLSERNVPGNDLKLYPRRPRLSSAWLTEPAPTKNKIMKAGRFVCFPKTLLASRITVFLPQPKYLRESGLRPGLTGPQQINSEWNSWLINSRFIRACSLGGKGSPGCCKSQLYFFASINHHFAMSSLRACASHSPRAASPGFW